ncbi:hypothetical protein [Paenarthrobacter sp. NPDC018779]|uniref:hypothetical protein n=1 Tax=Paenarthrobacter sp. NPDC018779 TaxID=3364375 RepID=UPI0037CBFFAA
MTEKTATTNRRPGTKLLIIGLVLAAIGLLLVIVGFSTTHVTLQPGTFRTVETPGAPTPFAWIMLIGGLILAAIGFGKRVLAVIEKR